MSESAASPLIGQEIGGRYKIVKLLGEGGMGAVFLGEQKLGATLRKVAIKTLHPHLSHDPKILARFERECETIAELQHPNTIQVYDFGKTDDGTLYIVMEFVEGRSVAEILEKEGPMDPPRVTKIMTQVCGSLEEAHSRGIVHRDLKPDNIVLCERAGQKDWVEVLDFGIAKRSSEQDPNEQKLTQQGMVLGTPPYMSPEQFTGKPIDARSDIYSLGVMAYEMLTGRLPFSGNTAWEWATQHMTARPVAIESLPVGTRVPPGMRAAINRALAKTPEERFQTVKDFIDAFGQDGPGAVAVSGRPPPDEPPRQKTEMSVPMQGGPPPGVYAPQPGPAMAPAPVQAGPGYMSPPSGNQAFSAPRSEEKKGPPKGLIFGAIGVLGIGSIIAVLAGLGVFKSKTDPTNGNVFAGATANTAVTTPTTAETVTPPPPDTTPTPTPPVAPLQGTNTGTVKPSTPKHDAGAPTTSSSVATQTPQPPPQNPQPPPQNPQPPPQNPQTPPPTKTPPPPPPQPKNIQECIDAARFCNHPAVKTDKAIGNLCTQKRQACFAKGGTL